MKNSWLFCYIRNCLKLYLSFFLSSFCGNKLELKNRSICKKTEYYIATSVLVLENELPCFMTPETKIVNMEFIIDAQKTHPSTMTIIVHDIMPMGYCTKMGSCVFSQVCIII